jgi:hypothetical protein
MTEAAVSQTIPVADGYTHRRSLRQTSANGGIGSSPEPSGGHTIADLECKRRRLAVISV